MLRKKAYSRRSPHEFGIEQARDPALVRAILDSTGLCTEGLDWPSACYLAAYQGDVPIGTVGIEARVDAALMRSLAVLEPMRHRGIGEALVKAARVAAHTRGARSLYTLASGQHLAWFTRFGFAPVPIATLKHALTGTFLVDYLRANQSDRLEQLTAMAVDITNDGVIER
jgi:N-acetylglutamate synthase-like GNAT family acetyltransferase